jgi:preprotein translocase subunit SecA
MGLTGDGLDADGLAEIGVREEVVDHLTEAFDQALEAREKQHGEDVWAQVERLVLLRTIDQLWVDHLTELDDMRRGIGLRGYGGIDPLNEFKREAFKLYEELRGFISKQVANTIFKVQVTAAPQQTFPMPIPAQLSGSSTSADGNGSQMDAITPVEGGHVHSDGTFHADSDAPATGAKPAAVGAAGAAVPALAAQQRRGVQYQHGDEATPSAGASGAPASAAKLGRNDPCWCGSGKKFKRCHGA